MQAGSRRAFDREQVLVAPQAPGAAGDGIARDLAFHLSVVVLDLIRAEARLANMDRRDGGAVSALLAFKAKNVTHFSTPSVFQLFVVSCPYSVISCRRDSLHKSQLSLGN